MKNNIYELGIHYKVYGIKFQSRNDMIHIPIGIPTMINGREKGRKEGSQRIVFFS